MLGYFARSCRVLGLLALAWLLMASCSVTQSLDELKGNPDGAAADAGADGADSGCTPKTCADIGAQCGIALDQCGGAIDCGQCADGEFCGGNGANQCGSFPCPAKTCTELAAECGKVSDGCGQVLDCGNCTAPETCGGGGPANVCGCTPKTCSELNASCGTVSDGCGTQLNCGSCTAPESCGGGGHAQPVRLHSKNLQRPRS